MLVKYYTKDFILIKGFLEDYGPACYSTCSYLYRAGYNLFCGHMQGSHTVYHVLENPQDFRLFLRIVIPDTNENICCRIRQSSAMISPDYQDSFCIFHGMEKNHDTFAADADSVSYNVHRIYDGKERNPGSEGQ